MHYLAGYITYGPASSYPASKYTKRRFRLSITSDLLHSKFFRRQRYNVMNGSHDFTCYKNLLAPLTNGDTVPTIIVSGLVGGA